MVSTAVSGSEGSENICFFIVKAVAVHYDGHVRVTTIVLLSNSHSSFSFICRRKKLRGGDGRNTNTLYPIIIRICFLHNRIHIY